MHCKVKSARGAAFSAYMSTTASCRRRWRCCLWPTTLPVIHVVNEHPGARGPRHLCHRVCSRQGASAGKLRILCPIAAGHCSVQTWCMGGQERVCSQTTPQVRPRPTNAQYMSAVERLRSSTGAPRISASRSSSEMLVLFSTVAYDLHSGGGLGADRSWCSL